MKKARANAKWATLTPKQTAALEQWFFVDKLSYAEVLQRAKTELGFSGSKSSLQRFHRRLRQERWLAKFMESRADTVAMAGARVNTGTMMASGLNMIALHFFEEIRDGVEELKDIPLLAKLLLQNESNEIHRDENRIREAGLELRHRALEFQKERWQFDIVEEAEEMLPELQELKQARADASDPYAERKRLNAIRIRLFGKERCPDLYPENAEEEAAQEAAKAREEAESERKYQEMLASRPKPPEPPEPVEQPAKHEERAEEPQELPKSAPNPPAHKLPDEKRFLTKILRPRW